MANPTFVLSVYTAKDEVTKRQVQFRQTTLRYVVVILACFVVFGCEYCFDTPSVSYLLNEGTINRNIKKLRIEIKRTSRINNF